MTLYPKNVEHTRKLGCKTAQMSAVTHAHQSASPPHVRKQYPNISLKLGPISPAAQSARSTLSQLNVPIWQSGITHRDALSRSTRAPNKHRPRQSIRLATSRHRAESHLISVNDVGSAVVGGDELGTRPRQRESERVIKRGSTSARTHTCICADDGVCHTGRTPLQVVVADEAVAL
jgi:hypothetical protein